MSDSINPAGEPLNLPEPQIGPNPLKLENVDLKQVMSELSGGAKATEVSGSKGTELNASITIPPTTNPSVDPASLALPIDATAKLTQINTPMTPVGSTAAASVSPAIADDEDLIEKEWVEKAKQIVERTKDDPHVQTQEIGQYKAEYVKKRFNKDLKIATEPEA